MHLHFFKAFALVAVLFTASVTAQCTCQGPNTFCNLASECCSNQCVNRGTPGFNMGKTVITFGGKKMSGKYKHTVRILDNTSNEVGRESIVKRCSHVSPAAARMRREVDSGVGTRAGPQAAGSAHAEGSADDAEVDGVRRTGGAAARKLEARRAAYPVHGGRGALRARSYSYESKMNRSVKVLISRCGRGAEGRTDESGVQAQKCPEERGELEDVGCGRAG
ncbi:hypothetical protein B0H14DRAFT_3148944 [Mycena olivaceomarginata]|nr:hypothetical protein B0H14DRAFT_3148944 [Mycena olivaceomarginata]